jgi:adenosylmethionine-8-amino-7-oxononanoate aminotransferase
VQLAQPAAAWQAVRVTRRADTRLWHPFSDMAAVRGDEFVVDRGEGVWIYDEDGNRYLDASASLWYCNVGHGRREIVDAVAEQMARLEAYSIFGDVATPPPLEVADFLAARAPMDDAKVFFTSGGGDAIDTAAKLARLYWQVNGEPDRVQIVSRVGSYHGTMTFGTSIAGIDANRTGYGPLVPSTSVVPHDSADALRAEIERLGAGRVAAFFVEPVIGAGGVYPPVPGYMEAVAEICRDTGVLLVVDAVIAGFGRIGDWFGCERFGVRPDLVTFAKGVTSGYLPLGGVLVSGRVAEPFWSERGRVLRHGQTYAGHASVCAAALANLAILEREQLIPRGRELERDLLDAVAPLADHPLVGEVRGGVGLLAAVGLAPEALERDPGLAGKAYKAIRPHGVILRALGRELAISPPLTITVEELGLIANAVRAGLDDLAETLEREPAQAAAG